MNITKIQKIKNKLASDMVRLLKQGILNSESMEIGPSSCETIGSGYVKIYDKESGIYFKIEVKVIEEKGEIDNDS